MANAVEPIDTPIGAAELPSNAIERSRWTEYGGWMVPTVLASVLCLANLGNHYLWDDEAQTALIAKTVLTHGVPLGFDGKNHFSQEMMSEYGPNYVWRWHTWLPFYILAGFFRWLGESTFVARLPFALAGIATVSATYFLARELWQNNRAATCAAIVLALNVPFLLLVRQCRYYSMTALFGTVMVIGYIRLMRGLGWRAGCLFVIGGLMLFHTQFFYVATFLAGLVAHAAIWHRNRMLSLIVWSAGLGALCSPWILWLTGMQYQQVYGDQLFDVRQKILFAFFYVRTYVSNALPPVALLGIVAAGTNCVRKKLVDSDRVDSIMCGLGCLSLVTLTTLAGLALTSPFPFYRYLSPLIPLTAVVIGGGAAAAAAIHRVLAIVVIGATLLHWPLVSFCYELTHDFDGPVEAIVQHLKREAGPSDTVLTTSENLSIMFYTRLKVYGGLTGEDLAPAAHADWIIKRKFPISYRHESTVYQFIDEHVDASRYEVVELDATDTPFENREEPGVHLFRTAPPGPRVTLWKRRR